MGVLALDSIKALAPLAQESLGLTWLPKEKSHRRSKPLEHFEQVRRWVIDGHAGALGRHLYERILAHQNNAQRALPVPYPAIKNLGVWVHKTSFVLVKHHRKVKVAVKTQKHVGKGPAQGLAPRPCDQELLNRKELPGTMCGNLHGKQVNDPIRPLEQTLNLLKNLCPVCLCHNASPARTISQGIVCQRWVRSYRMAEPSQARARAPPKI